MSPNANATEDRLLAAIKREMSWLSPKDALDVVNEMIGYSLPRLRPEYQDAIDAAEAQRDVIGDGPTFVEVPGAPAGVGGFVDASGKPFFFTTEPQTTER